MTCWLVSRHPGAIEWMRQQGVAVDRLVAHLDIRDIQPGDQVIGTLPIQLAAQVCKRGACYLHLTLDLPESLRGRELDAAQLHALGARLECYEIRQQPQKD